METIDRFKKAVENFKPPYDKGWGSFEAPEIIHNVEDIEALKKQIIQENENKISSYDINNFEKDFDEIMLPVIEKLENPDKNNTTNKFWDYAYKSTPIFLKDSEMLITLATLSNSDFYFIPGIKESFVVDGKIENKYIETMPVAIKNSFADLFLQKIEYIYQFYPDLVFFFDKNGKQKQNYNEVVIQCKYPVNYLVKAD